MTRKSFNAAWYRANKVTDAAIACPGTSFSHKETRQCQDGTILIRGSVCELEEACPKCGSSKFTVHAGKRENTERPILSTPVNGQQTYLLLESIGRRKCGGCLHTYTPAIPGVAKHHRVTTLLEDLIVRMAREHSFAQIQREVGVHPKVARSIFLNHPTTLQCLEARETPRILGIDGLYLGTSLTVLTNLETHSIWDVWDKGERSPKATTELRECFRRIKNSENVEAVVMDMSYTYKNLTREFLPNAAIIADRWHILRMHEKHFQKWSKGNKLPYRQALQKIRTCAKEETKN
jgi:transposase